MEIHVDAWDPSYGMSFDVEESGPERRSDAQAVVDLECPADGWHAIGANPRSRAPDVVLLVDGVRRIDCQMWITGAEETHLALPVSYAAGVVCCDLREGAAHVATTKIARGLFTASPELERLAAGSVAYQTHRSGKGDLKALKASVQARLHALEVEVSNEARESSDLTDDLLVVDGKLQGRSHLPRVLGYVKTHSVEFLPAALSAVVTGLRPGQRCPVFLLTTPWPRYSWYLRLPGPSGSPWAGIVRLECSADLLPQEAVALADRSVVTLPKFASTAYKDPRAPQNLVPIAGLERRLRAMLGDARLLHRALSNAARRPILSSS